MPLDLRLARSTLWKVYILVSSSEGSATLSIDYPMVKQNLIVPVFPNNSLPEVLPLLEPGFAHYASQWKKVPIDLQDEEGDAVGFCLSPADVPERIADPSHAPALAEIATKHLTPEVRRLYGKMLPVPALGIDVPFDLVAHSNIEEICQSPEAFNIDPFPGRPSS